MLRKETGVDGNSEQTKQIPLSIGHRPLLCLAGVLALLNSVKDWKSCGEGSRVMKKRNNSSQRHSYYQGQKHLCWSLHVEAGLARSSDRWEGQGPSLSFVRGH